MVVNSMGYATYDSYKDSGVDWLGEIPSDWELLKVKNIFRLVMKFAPKNNDCELLSVYTDIGVKPRKELEERGNRATTTDGYLIVEKGDIVVNKLLAWMGAIGLSDYDGVTSPAYDILKPKIPIEGIFYHLLFRSPQCTSELRRYSRGIMDMRLRLYFDKFGDVVVPYPNIKVQKKIVSFLAEKTAQIDQAIALKQQQIEKLNEYKQIVIQNAVTKGLNPNVPMKDSGVEWIGDIPEHWDVKKLKYLTSKIGSGITPSGGATTYVDKGIPLLRSQNIHFDGLVLDNVANISLNVHKSMKNSQVKQHDVLLNITGGSLGRCCYNSSNDEMNVNQHVCIVRPNNLIKGEFLNGLMSSEVGQKQIWFFQQGGGREGLNFQNLKNFDFPLPSIDEQKEIIAHIESLKQHFKKSVDNYQTQIDRLKEYKNILINQAVTGKIKI